MNGKRKTLIHFRMNEMLELERLVLQTQKKVITIPYLPSVFEHIPKNLQS